MAAEALSSDTPGGRLKLMVVAGKVPWWLTASGVWVVSTRAMSERATCPPAGVLNQTERSDSGLVSHSGRQLHHHPVLVERVVDRRDLALAEGVVERRIDGAHGEPQAGHAVAVEHQAGLHALVLLVGADVGEFRQRHQGAADARFPLAQVAEMVGLQGVLIVGVARTAADAHVLGRGQEQAGAGLVRQLAAQPRHDLVGRDPAARSAASG